jgi:multiple sugar transport system substrate-binding protein
LPIDAAAQVQAWRRDLIDAPALTWNEALALARKGLVNCPMRPPHSLIMVFTLCANLGAPCAVEGPDLFDSEVGVRAVCLIREFVSLIDPACFDMDPIAVLEQMARADTPIACAPLTYGYISYSYALLGGEPNSSTRPLCRRRRSACPLERLGRSCDK